MNNFADTDICAYNLPMTERDGIFEWESEKAKANWLKHRVDFRAAKEAFTDPQALEVFDDLHSAFEPRFSLIGVAGERLLFVVFKELSHGSVRIIFPLGLAHAQK